MDQQYDDRTSTHFLSNNVTPNLVFELTEENGQVTLTMDGHNANNRIKRRKQQQWSHCYKGGQNLFVFENNDDSVIL